MRHRKTKYTLDRAAGPRNALLKNLAESLVLHARIRTTATKARAVRSLAEQLVGWGKRNDLHGRRMLRRYLSESVTSRMMKDIAPQLVNRQGGYTRLTPLGARYGDGAQMVVLEYLVDPKKEHKEKTKEKKTVKKSEPAAKIEKKS